MNKTFIAKKAITYIVGAGASKIVHTIIKNNVQPEKALEKIEVLAGSTVLGMMVADATKTYTDTKIEESIVAFKEIRTKFQEARKNQETA